jgi:uncharacterized 2Fe-2S/4Fe-4S cluster protein (DUF4445 family)
MQSLSKRESDEYKMNEVHETALFSVDLEPIGRRARVAAEMTLLEAAQSAGVELVAVCGGIGACGKCRVRLMQGTLSAPTTSERSCLGEEGLAAGYRLACQARPLSDVKIDVPPESLTTLQRLQVEGFETEVELSPAVKPLDVDIDAPDLYDLRADTVRLQDTLAASDGPSLKVCLPVLREFSERMRAQNWRVRLALRDVGRIMGPSRVGQGIDLFEAEAVAILPQDSALFGLAVDIGTTKMAAYLVDLTTGETVAKAGLPNPQIPYGEDVVSRIAYTNTHADGREVLQGRVVEGLNTLVGELCEQVQISRDQVVDAVVVGNTAIHHLFVGLPVRQLGSAPYLPAVSEPLEVCAFNIGLEIAPGAYVYLPPNIAGYVGADHVSVLLATDAWRSPVNSAPSPTSVVLDIGTNTEISLVHEGRILSCSCASGPAFEGAHIHDGMRAAPGAIERVRIANGTVRVQAIGRKPPVGICGTGILDAVAGMRAAQIVSSSGRLNHEHPRVQVNGDEGGSRPSNAAFLLVPSGETGHGRDIWVTRRDVNEIQLAKGAIRAGIEVLLREAEISSEAIDAFIVAGAFGTYLDIDSAVQVGMFPDLPRDRFRQVGNAAGIGAKQMLVSVERREIVSRIVERVEYIELTTHPQFTDVYMEALVL